MRKTYCIICGKEKKGIEVREDRVIQVLRWFKRNVTKDEQGNRLVVCGQCYPDYKKRRAKFLSRQRLYVAVGLLLTAAIVLISLNFFAFIAAALMSLALYGVSFAKYTPDLMLKAGSRRR